MSFELIAASVAITAALGFYTWGVFGERLHGALTGKYLALFWAGLVCDSTGTFIMTNIAKTSGAPLTVGLDVHGLTGMLAIVLMLVHAVWATYTYFRGSEKAQERFHTFSTIVWLVWLVPYIIGMLIGIPVFHLRVVCAVGTSAIIVAALAVALFHKKSPRHHA